MNENVRFVNNWRGYYTEDCDCIYCLFKGAGKSGCLLERCCCEEEKQDAVAHNRIERKRGSMRWDG